MINEQFHFWFAAYKINNRFWRAKLGRCIIYYTYIRTHTRSTRQANKLVERFIENFNWMDTSSKLQKDGSTTTISNIVISSNTMIGEEIERYSRFQECRSQSDSPIWNYIHTCVGFDLRMQKYECVGRYDLVRVPFCLPMPCVPSHWIFNIIHTHTYPFPTEIRKNTIKKANIFFNLNIIVSI